MCYSGTQAGPKPCARSSSLLLSWMLLLPALSFAGEVIWSKRVIEEAGEVTFISDRVSKAGLAPNGRPAFLYWQTGPAGDNRHLVFTMRRTGGKGFKRVNASPGDLLASSAGSFAFDSERTLHVAYQSNFFIGQGTIEYVTLNGPELLQEQIAGADAKKSSLALDPSGKPYVAYIALDGPKRDLRMASREPGGWVSESILTVSNDISRLELAIDDSGTQRLAYMISTGSEYLLRMATRSGTDWEFETIDVASVPSGPANLDLALDSDGDPHVGYSTYDGPPEVRYAQWDGASWQAETVLVGDTRNVAMTLDADDSPHFSYFDLTQIGLGYSARAGAGWSHQIVDDEGLSGYASSIVVDANRVAHILYYRDAISDIAVYAVSSPLPSL